MRPSRRELMKWVTASGITLGISRLSLADTLGFLVHETLPGRGVSRPASGRVDGVAKATGAKLYASDFRAADLPGWPGETSHALLVRAADATHVYSGLDLERLGKLAPPSVVVTAADLERIGTRVPEFYTGDLFCPVGKTPLYLGQPVALLIFDTFDAFDRARLALREDNFLRFGAETGPVPGANYAAFRFTRVAGATPDAPDIYSPIQEGWISPGFLESSGRPIWQPLPVAKGGEYVKGATYGEDIRAALARKDPSILTLARDFETQSVDPMFLEPEAGLAWFDSASKDLKLVLGVQSPFEAGSAIAFLLGEAADAYKPSRIDAQFAYVGGGFGGRDHTPFPLYVALAAMFFPGRPVRLAHDRYQQFQGGIKRHPFKMHSEIGIDRATGKIVAFAADHVLDGGGLMNYSTSVAVVGATGATGIYDVPKVDVTTVAVHSRGVTAGSMRGYGTLQTMTALEVLVDEAAAALPLDPIEFRRRNALKVGGRTMTGNPYSVSVRTPEILDKLDRHAIWKRRAEEKARAPAGVLIGTGVACSMKDYGTGADCSLGTVSIDPEGRISIHSDAVEMGNGIGTALANRVALHLGSIADEVTVAQVDVFDALGLFTSGDAYLISQEEQDTAARDTGWVPAISSATSASIGAHVGTQAAAEAARVVFRFGLWPAALDLWGIAPNDPRSKQSDEAFWQDGYLVMSGLSPLPLKAIAAKAHARKGVTGAMAHAFSRWAWSQATFAIGDQEWTADIDALAIQLGSAAFTRLDRSAVAFPPADYNRIGTAFSSLCGTLVRVEIERATGVLRIAKAYSVLECGQVLVPEVVVGQAQGGFAMGVGYALLETLPPFEEGPGNGKWNLGQYLIARGSDLPLHDLEIEVLPPFSPKEPPKGMAEVVMIPIVPALLNAIFDATGHRFNALPVTQAMLKGVLA
ncbi:xanthine dehydrogenase family protein molybdopterin-binding subunit [Microvirga brassicacearum]|uniref:Xanthine dehydrogenase family protein molybdopterin-binding subunit n=1 Tax=Microvirga brassicacearum TaxID=2580413 RepID=A0A5N3P3B6_9HYPH|nr:molybdopterin cofactor-binding domain-containing protein [Microvirga brassicacearum]KAB0264215.1 xanthine dehydrogenase family protein molybdopterin-binding subunit [Microvirga brassicacearum]